MIPDSIRFGGDDWLRKLRKKKIKRNIPKAFRRKLR